MASIDCYFNQMDLDRSNPWCEMITGPMMSGKSTELLRRIRDMKLVPKCKVTVITSKKDNRYGEKVISTHYNLQMKAFASGDSLLESAGSLIDIKKTTHMFIEESQFFNDIIEFIQKCLEHGICVTIAGLDTDYEGKPWPYIAQAVGLSRKVDKLQARCVFCGSAASATVWKKHHPKRWKGMMRKYGSGQLKLSKSTDEMITGVENKYVSVPSVGGSEMYAPVCWRHFNEYTKIYE